MSAEVWARHPVYVDYDVSTLGRVRRATPKKGTRVGLIKVARANATGYLTVMVGVKPRKVHALVLETFVGPRPEGHDACHNDGDRTNNVLANLRWATRAENMADARVHGTDSRCDRHPAAKLTWEQVRDIRARYAAGELQKHLAPQYGVSKAHVSYVINKGWNP
jgi:hypothetical protein